MEPSKDPFSVWKEVPNGFRLIHHSLEEKMPIKSSVYWDISKTVPSKPAGSSWWATEGCCRLCIENHALNGRRQMEH